MTQDIDHIKGPAVAVKTIPDFKEITGVRKFPDNAEQFGLCVDFARDGNIAFDTVFHIAFGFCGPGFPGPCLITLKVVQSGVRFPNGNTGLNF
jgi:hypothetical protein